MGKEIHIYGQNMPHAEAFIVGNREALSALARMIAAVLSGESTAADEFFTGDGEGFVLGILLGPDNLGDWEPPYSGEEYPKPQGYTRKPWEDTEMRDRMLRVLNRP